MASSTVTSPFVCVFLSALLQKAHSMPFHVRPSTMANVVKGLYALRPGKWLQETLAWSYLKHSYNWNSIVYCQCYLLYSIIWNYNFFESFNKSFFYVFLKCSVSASIIVCCETLMPCYSSLEWCNLAPALFSQFIPQIHPPAVESQLSDYAAQDQKLQMELSLNGFPRYVYLKYILLQMLVIINIQ